MDETESAAESTQVCMHLRKCHHIRHAQHPQLTHTLPGASAGHSFNSKDFRPGGLASNSNKQYNKVLSLGISTLVAIEQCLEIRC